MIQGSNLEKEMGSPDYFGEKSLCSFFLRYKGQYADMKSIYNIAWKLFITGCASHTCGSCLLRFPKVLRGWITLFGICLVFNIKLCSLGWSHGEDRVKNPTGCSNIRFGHFLSFQKCAQYRIYSFERRGAL